MTPEQEAMRVIDEFYARHPEQRRRTAHEVAAFIRRLPPDERAPLEQATGTLARMARRLMREVGGAGGEDTLH